MVGSLDLPQSLIKNMNYYIIRNGNGKVIDGFSHHDWKDTHENREFLIRHLELDIELDANTMSIEMLPESLSFRMIGLAAIAS